MKTIERYRPTGLNETIEKELGVIFFNNDSEAPRAIAYRNRKSKRDWFYRFTSKEQRENFINDMSSSADTKQW